MYEVNLEKFSGPLDFLLDLIETKKLAINEISLAQVTDQFLDYLEKLKETFNSGFEGKINFELERLVADFLVVASRLILIKSRSLLPSLVLTSEEEDDIKDLERRLEEYRRIKELSSGLKKLSKGAGAFYARELYRGFQVVFFPPKNITKEILTDAYQAVLKTLPQIQDLKTATLNKIVTLEEKMKELLARISNAAEVSFAKVVSGGKNKIDIVLAFLAILMLFRKQILDIRQDRLFGEIKIKSRLSDGLG